MTDFFALLQLPRSPWLDPEQVNARFLELSAPVHPDRVHGGSPETIRAANESFAQLNSAATCLRDPKSRLHHLLQLESGAPSTSQSIPPELMDLFGRVGQTLHAADQFLAERAKATSPVLQAQLFAQALDWTDRISDLQTAVAALRSSAESELKAINDRWPAEKPITRLQALAHIFATTQRWESQLKERFAVLAAP